MFNPLFNMMGMLNQLKQNPLGLLAQAGYKVPSNLNSPQAILQHLTQTGQINQQMLNQAQQMAQMFNANMR